MSILSGTVLESPGWRGAIPVTAKGAVKPSSAEVATKPSSAEGAAELSTVKEAAEPSSAEGAAELTPAKGAAEVAPKKKLNPPSCVSVRVGHDAPPSCGGQP